VWLPTKIEASLAAMREAEAAAAGPVLVCADAAIEGPRLEPIAPSFWRYSGFDGHPFDVVSIAAENPIVGCTVMANRTLVERASPIPDEAVMHDWWLALVAAREGRIIRIDRPLVRYRQHGRNALGARPASFGALARRLLSLRDVVTKNARRLAQAHAFSRRYGASLGALALARAKAASLARKVARAVAP
jgi:hypothetical protein